MRFSLVAAALLGAASASASTLLSRQSPYPPCALTCLATANFGNCDQTDFSCLCKNKDFIDPTTACIMKGCQGDDLQKSLETAQAACKAAGVDLTATSSATSTSESETSTSTSGTTSTTGTTSGTSTSRTSSATSPASTTPTSTGTGAPASNSNAASIAVPNALFAAAAGVAAFIL